MTTTDATRFIAEPATAADVLANDAAAAALGLTCPKCGELGHAVASHLQATRTVPCRFTGVDVHCTCEPTFLEGRPLVASFDADELARDHAA